MNRQTFLKSLVALPFAGAVDFLDKPVDPLDKLVETGSYSFLCSNGSIKKVYCLRFPEDYGLNKTDTIRKMRDSLLRENLEYENAKLVCFKSYNDIMATLFKNT